MNFTKLLILTFLIHSNCFGMFYDECNESISSGGRTTKKTTKHIKRYDNDDEHEEVIKIESTSVDGVIVASTANHLVKENGKVVKDTKTITSPTKSSNFPKKRNKSRKKINFEFSPGLNKSIIASCGILALIGICYAYLSQNDDQDSNI